MNDSVFFPKSQRTRFSQYVFASYLIIVLALSGHYPRVDSIPGFLLAGALNMAIFFLVQCGHALLKKVGAA